MEGGESRDENLLKYRIWGSKEKGERTTVRMKEKGKRKEVEGEGVEEGEESAWKGWGKGGDASPNTNNFAVFSSLLK